MEDAPRDYVAIAKRYAQKAIRDKKRKRHGLLIQQASKRFLDDLKRSRLKRTSFFFDEWYANDACDFIEKLPHVEGTWSKPTIELHPSHVFFVVQLFGFRKKESLFIAGYGEFHPRRYTSALFAVARKNAKSTLSACVMNYCMCCEPEPGAQLYSAATTYDQAAIIFKVAKAQADKTPELKEAFGLETWAKAITKYDTGASFKALHSKASTQDGLNPSHTALDEIHAHKDPDLLNVLKSAAGARKNPLFLYTTTEGYTNPGPWGDIRHYAKQLLAGVFGNESDHFLVVFYAIDEENKTLGIKADDEFDKSVWIKANPLMDVNPDLEGEIRKQAIEAKHMPSQLAEFRIKRVNRPSASAGGWVNLVRWEECSGEVDLDWLAQYPCYGGLDLASTTDIASFRLVWDVDGVLYTHGWRFVPDNAVLTRSTKGTVPYASWVEQGLLIQTEGEVTDYSKIEETIIGCSERFNIVEVAYDDWNSSDIVSRLIEEDIEFAKFIQGPKSYHPAMKSLEEAYIGKRLAHGGDPVLHWCASNLIDRRDQNMNMAPDKRKSADKIDDMVALIMAVGASLAGEDTSSVYEERGLRTF